jgi:hypothetical protein
MPRRKISIEDAFAALDEAGIHVQVKSVQPELSNSSRDQPNEQGVRPSDIVGLRPERKRVTTVTPTTVKIALYAKHSIGSGGVEVMTPQGKVIQNNGVQYYGPGIVTVSKELAEALLYQDALARQTDENTFSTERKSFLIVNKRDADGNRANVGIRIDNGEMDDLLSIPDGHLYRM